MRMKSTATFRLSTFAWALFVVVACTPVPAEAAYTFQGRTFSTYSEYVAYVADYLRVYRELQSETEHGGADMTPQSTTVSQSTSRLGTVSTSFSRDVDATSARITGVWDGRRGAYANVWFEHGPAPRLLTKQTAYQTIQSYGRAHTFDAKIRGLSPESTYYYRAAAKTADGVVSYGEVRALTSNIDYSSDAAEVTVSTKRAFDLDETYATLSGGYRLGNTSGARVYFIYGTSEDTLDDTSPTKVVRDEDSRSFDVRVRGLQASTKYYFRAVAEDQYGVKSYGKLSSFTTRKDVPNEAPTLTLERTLNVTPYSATLVGDVDMNDARDGIVFFVYGESRDDIRNVGDAYIRYSQIRERGDDRQVVLLDRDLDSLASYEYTARDLDPSTRYYYAIGVEYENEFDDRLLIVGSVKTVTTRRQ
jgi:hypothetical protein